MDLLTLLVSSAAFTLAVLAMNYPVKLSGYTAHSSSNYFTLETLATTLSHSAVRILDIINVTDLELIFCHFIYFSVIVWGKYL